MRHDKGGAAWGAWGTVHDGRGLHEVATQLHLAAERPWQRSVRPAQLPTPTYILLVLRRGRGPGPRGGGGGSPSVEASEAQMLFWALLL